MVRVHPPEPSNPYVGWQLVRPTRHERLLLSLIDVALMSPRGTIVPAFVRSPLLAYLGLGSIFLMSLSGRYVAVLMRERDIGDVEEHLHRGVMIEPSDLMIYR